MRICVHKATNKIIEMQSLATAGTLISNAVRAGYIAGEIEERVVDNAGYEAAKLADTQYQADILAVKNEQKIIADAINLNLPDWATIDNAITNISNLADVKIFLRRLSRVVYCHVRNKSI